MKALAPSDMKCPVTGQTAYVTRDRALKVRDRVYRCPHCRWWHLGKRRKNGTTHNP